MLYILVHFLCSLNLWRGDTLLSPASSNFGPDKLHVHAEPYVRSFYFFIVIPTRFPFPYLNRGNLSNKNLIGRQTAYCSHQMAVVIQTFSANLPLGYLKATCTDVFGL